MTCEHRGRTIEMLQSRSSEDAPVEVPPLYTQHNKLDEKQTVDLRFDAIQSGP